MDTESDTTESNVSLLHETREKTSDFIGPDRFPWPFSSIYRRGICSMPTLLSLVVNLGLVLLLMTRNPNNCSGQDVTKYGFCLAFCTFKQLLIISSKFGTQHCHTIEPLLALWDKKQKQHRAQYSLGKS
jgi:hypothetical protein